MRDDEVVGELLFTEADATPMSTDEATIRPWSQARTCLESAPKAWLGTVRPDGRPHTAPLVLVWVDEAPWFGTRPDSRKAGNLAANPHCVVTVAGGELDLVLEGEARPVRDEGRLRRVADAFLAAHEWELNVRDGRVHDDALPGSPEYGFYRITLTRAYGYGLDGLTATRWRFR